MKLDHMLEVFRSFRVKSFQRWIALGAVLVVLDQLTKRVVVEMIGPFDNISVLPFLSLVFTMNPGAAFSFLSDASGWQRWFFSAVAVVATIVILVMLSKHSSDRFLSFSLTLVLGGAIGNLIDRVVYGAVIDFVLLFWRDYHWPAFNIADTCITLGAIGLLFDGFFRRRV